MSGPLNLDRPKMKVTAPPFIFITLSALLHELGCIVYMVTVVSNCCRKQNTMTLIMLVYIGRALRDKCWVLVCFYFFMTYRKLRVIWLWIWDPMLIIMSIALFVRIRGRCWSVDQKSREVLGIWGRYDHDWCRWCEQTCWFAAYWHCCKDHKSSGSWENHVRSFQCQHIGVVRQTIWSQGMLSLG